MTIQANDHRFGRPYPWWRRGSILCSLAAVTIASLVVAAERTTPATPVAVQKEALAEFNELIGGWRGIGMPRRGSRNGAWSETAEWVWTFDKKDKNSVAIDYTIKKGKQLQSGRVTYDSQNKVYRLAGLFADKARRDYEGRLRDKKLVFESKPDKGYVHVITITKVNEKRALVLYQKRRDGSKFLTRVAEVGYTRAGTSLAVAGAGEIECIVTGGKGTIKVSYKGQTYYVCCSGCKIAFDDDPAGVIAEYKRKVAERKKKREKKS